MKKQTGKSGQKSFAIALFCSAVYFCSYLTRKDFAIALVAITEATGFGDAAIAFVPVCLFITYGIGQTVNGVIGDHIRPQFLITGGMLLSAGCNLLLPVCANVPAMCVVWGINGFAQAMLWPPIAKILIYTYSGARYSTASMIVSTSASLATVAGYLYIPAVLTVAKWQTVFYIGAAIVLLCAVPWFFYSFRKDFIGENTKDLAQKAAELTEPAELAEAAPEAPEKPAAKEPKLPGFVLLPFGLILLDVILCGMLRDGVETWMPTFVKESFHISPEKSILISVLLALFSCICIILATIVYRRFFRNELIFCASIFLLGTGFGVILYFSNGKNMLLSTLSISLIGALMHGVNLALTAYVPQRMKRFGHVCTISGIVNSAIYIGAALSTYGIASVKDRFGWNATIGMWIAIAAAGVLLSLVTALFWHRRVLQDEKETK